MKITIRVYIMCTLFLGILTGCDTTKQAVKLSDVTDVRSRSLSAYFELDKPVFQGEMFEVKVLDAYVIRNPSAALNYYSYRVVISPIYDTPLTLESVYVETNNKDVNTYFSSASPVGANELLTWNSLTHTLEFDRWEEASDFDAYELKITFNNLTDVYQDAKSISDDVLMNALKDLKITLKYDTKSDVVNVSISEIQPIPENILKDREDLKGLINGEATQNWFQPYTNVD